MEDGSGGGGEIDKGENEANISPYLFKYGK